MWPEDPARVRPMLASLGEVPLVSPLYAYEPKYDGIRALVAIEPVRAPRPSASAPNRPAPARVRIWSRLGNDKGGQFPELVTALGDAFATLSRPVLLDGEIVALDRRGVPTTFLHLQSRIHLLGPSGEHLAAAAFIAFDVLFDDATDLRSQPLRDRRASLEALLDGRLSPVIRLAPQAIGDGSALQARAQADNWEGLIAKKLDAPYVSGKRTLDWCKLKLVRQQTCIIGGWTDPRGTRARFGSLLLGVYDDQERLVHVGQVGTGFSDTELERVWQMLRPLAVDRSPFVAVPREVARAHWVRPELVCEVKFTEWTLDDKLRHPTYLGMRDDVMPKRVRREPQAGSGASTRTLATRPRRSRPAPSSTVDKRRHTNDAATEVAVVLDQLDAIQKAGGDGEVRLPGGERLAVTNLDKVFWPALGLTKGDLMRHYARVAHAILPALADRPLVMKRYPNGVAGKPFYQHRADRVPPGVRIATMTTSDGDRPHVIGGSLLALLYTSQLAAISQDPWFSRVGSPDMVDAVAIDLDPPDNLPFRTILDVALRVRDELEALGAQGFVKTSGSRGLHIFIPMPARTPYDAGLLYAQIVATMVARKHGKYATVERTVSARGRRVYLDYLQNMRGKTLASVYSVRANAWAGVSTPLTWEEVEQGVSPQDFTIGTIATRLDDVGDLWTALGAARGANLRAVMKYAEPAPRR